ncbi:MAG: FecR domain-containing protein [Armatimonadota bacterium]
MNKNIVPEDIELSKLMKEHSEESKMSDTFKSELLNQMHKAIDNQKGKNSKRLFKRSIIGTALAACLYFLALQFHIPQMIFGTDQKPFVWNGPVYAVSPVKSVQTAEYLAVTSVYGKVVDASGNPINIGDHLSARTELCTGKDGRVTVVTPKGTQFHLDSNTRLQINGSNGKIVRGRMYCSNRIGEIKSIDTPGGHIKLLGTVINAAVLSKYSSAITVVKGKVQLSNAHGMALVESGKRSVLMANNEPLQGNTANIAIETAWYDGRNRIVSDTGKIVYQISLPGNVSPALTQIWAMNADGTGKHLVKTYTGWVSARDIKFWMPGSQWILITSDGLSNGKIDYERRNALSYLGYTIGGGTWLLNVETGQDMPFEVSGDNIGAMELSPDGTKLAYTNWSNPEVSGTISKKTGLYIYNLQTGENRKVLGGAFATKISWSPDGEHLFINADHKQYSQDRAVLMVNTETGDSLRIAEKSAGAQISPDGKRIAYWSDFKNGSIESYGVPQGGSVYVRDLVSNSRTKKLTEWGQGYDLTWSPDGSQILYRETVEDWDKFHSGGELPQHFKLFIANTDGSGVDEIVKGDDELVSTAWTPDGNGIYARTRNDILLINTNDLSIKRLVGARPIDAFTSDERNQTDQALSAIREAVFQYAMGDELRKTNKVSEARIHYKLAGDLFNQLAWRYPLLRFGTEDIGRCADQAFKKAAQ